MKRETERIGELQPGSLTKKAGKEVQEKNEAVSVLVDKLLKETNDAEPDDKKIQDSMDRLTDELWDTVN
jgi:hypothetical protein